jgi:hypothetical protein
MTILETDHHFFRALSIMEVGFCWRTVVNIEHALVHINQSESFEA